MVGNAVLLVIISEHGHHDFASKILLRIFYFHSVTAARKLKDEWPVVILPSLVTDRALHLKSNVYIK